jgi:erythromycin esterase
MRTLALTAFLLAACSGHSAPRSVPAPAPAPAPVAPPKAPAPPAEPPDPFVSMNLGFEDADGDKPKGWWVGDPADIALVTDVKHGGDRALRIRPTGGEFRAAAGRIDAKPYVGKHITLRGWIKTDATADGAALWLRVDGGEGAFDNMGDKKLTGTRPWTEASVEVDVPQGAEALIAGAMVIGRGTAWFDDLRITVSDVKPAGPIVIEGTVTDPAGAPVANAEVALIGASQDIMKHVKSDAGGRFHFDAKAGKWGFSAHRPGAGVGVFIDQKRYEADVRDLKLALGKDGGVTVRGKSVVKPAGETYLQISPFSQHDADLFAVPLAPDGTFQVVLPRGDKYTVSVLEGGVAAQESYDRKGDVVDVVLKLAQLGPPPAEVVAYIGKQAIPLVSAEAGKGLDDMAPIGKLVGNARIVALGEATHGTREFFQLKHRFLEYLVAKQGFTVFAIEANQPECRAINDYVLHGTGTAKEALKGIYFWTWNTEEVLAMIEWMRVWNADPAHKQKVQFTGFDMQTAVVAHATVTKLLEKVAPDQVKALTAPLAILGDARAITAVAKLPADEQKKLLDGLAAVSKAFEANRKAWTAATDAATYADARHDLRILEQATQMYIAGERSESFDIRDRSMAENVGWLLDQTKAKLVVWAHNGHIANTLVTFTNMGSHLRKRYKRDYVNFGFVFGEGSFQAIDFTTETRKLKEFTLGPAPESNASVAFSRTGKPLLVLDLRALPKRGPVHDWFSVAHPVRDTGAGFSSEKGMTYPQVLPDLYDAVIFVDKTTRARPLPGPKFPG